jgi:hypothetical protein
MPTLCLPQRLWERTPRSPQRYPPWGRAAGRHPIHENCMLKAILGAFAAQYSTSLEEAAGVCLDGELLAVLQA